MIPLPATQYKKNIDQDKLALGLALIHKCDCFDLPSKRNIRRLNRQWCLAGNTLIDKIAVVDQVTSQTLSKFYEISTLTVEGNSPSAFWTQKHFAQLKALNNLVELNFANSHCISDDSLKHLQALTDLKKLSFINCSNLKGHGFNQISILSKLSDLRWTNLEPEILIQNEGLKAIEALSSLSELSFGTLNSRQIDLLVENKCFNLTDLTIENGFLKSSAVVKASAEAETEFCSRLHSNLNEIIQRDVEEYKASIISEFKSLPEENRRSILVAEQKSLLSLPLLASLDISDLSTLDGGYEMLGNLTNLTRLALYHDRFFTDSSPLNRLVKLHSLNIIGDITQLNFELASIKYLELDLTFLNTQTLAASVTNLKHLEILKFSVYRSPGSPCFEFFATMDKLRKLTYKYKDEVKTNSLQMSILPPQQITKPFPNLTNLELSRVRMTTDRFKFVKTFPNLKRINFTDCDVDLKDVNQLQLQRSDFKICLEKITDNSHLTEQE